MTQVSNQSIRIEAKTVEAAIVMACFKLGVTQDSIEYEVLKQPKGGLLSFFGGKAEIKAWARSGRQGANRAERGGQPNRGGDRSQNGRGDRKDMKAGGRDQQQSGRDGNRDQNRNRSGNGRKDQQQARGPGRDRNEERKPREFTPREERPPAEPLTPEVVAQLEIEIRNFCKELCEKIVGETVNVTSQMDPDKLKLEVDNAAIAELIQQQGKFIESLEHILRKKPRHLKQDLPFRIFIDAQGSRKGREEELARVAREKADHVAETGQKVVLDYKSAADRKIVHMTLENDNRVYTKSIGTGSNRKLMILASRGRKPTAEAQEEGDDANS